MVARTRPPNGVRSYYLCAFQNIADRPAMEDHRQRSRSPFGSHSAQPAPWREEQARSESSTKGARGQKRTFKDICNLPKVQQMFKHRLNDEHREEQVQFQARTQARLSSESPRVWLEAIWQCNDDDLWNEAMSSIQNYEWTPTKPPAAIREGWSPHRELHWAWTRAPGNLRPSQSLTQRQIFMFMGRPYTVYCSPQYVMNFINVTQCRSDSK